MDRTGAHSLIITILEQGVPFDTVLVLLLFPLIATFVVILRQVFGLQAFGIYTPSIITIAFMAIGLNSIGDIKYAIAVYVVVIAVGMIMRYVLKSLRLLYLPRVAITLTIVTFSVLILLIIAGSLDRTGLATASFFPLLIIITMVEKFVAVQIEKDSKTALILALETLGIAIVGYLIMSPVTAVGGTIGRFILAHPYMILLVLPLHIFLGRWTGLRASEYLRFRDVLKQNR